MYEQFNITVCAKMEDEEIYFCKVLDRSGYLKVSRGGRFNYGLLGNTVHYRRRLHMLRRNLSSCSFTITMELVCSVWMSVTAYPTTRCESPEEQNKNMKTVERRSTFKLSGIQGWLTPIFGFIKSHIVFSEIICEVFLRHIVLYPQPKSS
jgi:hypothetical protein